MKLSPLLFEGRSICIACCPSHIFVKRHNIWPGLIVGVSFVSEYDTEDNLKYIFYLEIY